MWRRNVRERKEHEPLFKRRGREARRGEEDNGV
jgi:hypothetical protein